MFKKKKPTFFPSTTLMAANLYELYAQFGGSDGLDYQTENGDHIIVKGDIDIKSLQRTTIYLGEGGNEIIFDGLKKVIKLEVAAIKNSKIKIQTPTIIRGLTIMASKGSQVSLGKGCMISTDVVIYSSNAHALYNVADGKRRSKDGVYINSRVWIGMGAKILAGARIGENSTIGAYSILAGKIPNNCAAAGNPCRVTTKNVFWTSTGHDDKRDYFSRTGESTLPSFAKITEDNTFY